MNPIFRKNQQGATLIVGMVLLLVITIIAFAGVRGTQMQERMTSNLNNKSISYMSAEAGVARFIEWTIEEGWPGEGQPDNATVGNRGGQFRFPDTAPNNVIWDDPPGQVEFVSVGETVIDGNVMAESRIRVRLQEVGGNQNDDGDGEGGIPRIAPYVCYGTACDLRIGGAATIDGRSYSLPEEYPCSGGGCRTDTPNPPIGVMGVYMPEAGGRVCKTTGNPNNRCYPTQNSDPSNIQYVDGGIYQDEETGITESVPNIVINPSDAEGALEAILDGAPDPEYWTSMIEMLPDPFMSITSSSDVPNGALNPRDEPKFFEVTGGDTVRINSNSNMTGVMVVRAGTTLTLNGTMNFEGLILLEEGAVFDLSNGNATIYGSVVSIAASETNLDASLLGNISLRYSDEAIGRVGEWLGLEPGEGEGEGGGIRRVLTWVEEIGET